MLPNIINQKSNNYISWEEYFMGLAVLSSGRSKDNNTQVGACIVSPDNKILSMGYNGAPNGFSDDIFPWSREGEELETKYPFVVHAERNAVLNYRGDTEKLKGATLYVTLFPCNECAKEIIQVGITKIVFYSDKYANTNSVKAAKIMFDTVGVFYEQYKGRNFSIQYEESLEKKGKSLELKNNK